MKVIIFFIFAMGITESARSQSGTVELIVDGIDAKKQGELFAGIFFKENFPSVGKQLIGQSVTVNSTQMRIIFKDVPVGVYAIAVFQDVDKDKKLTTNFIGLPREPIGFSNNARIRFGPPSFEDAKFAVEKKDEKQLKITLR